MAIQIRTGLDEPETGKEFVPHRPQRPEKAEGGRKFRIVLPARNDGGIDAPGTDRGDRLVERNERG